MENSPQEIKLLQNCINDLMSVLALPAIWSGSDSSQVINTLLDAVVTTLRLDFAYARFLENGDGSEIDILRLAKGQTTSVVPRDVGLTLKDLFTDASPTRTSLVPNPIGAGEVFVAPLRLGLHDEIGFLVAASKRRDFPTRIETLLLRVAANQAVVGLQEAHLLSEQKRAAEELEQRIADRTGQITAVNVELVREIGVRERTEEELRKSKERVEMILDSITDNFFAIDNEWRYTHFNKHAEEQLGLLGKNPASLIGKALWNEFPIPGSEEQLRRAMSEREVVTDEQYSPLLGEWYENRIYPNPDGGLAIFQRYVTQRKRAERRLLKSEEKYRTLFDSIDEGFCTIEVLFDGKDKAVDYRFLEINPSFEKQTGIKDALGRTMREIAPQHEEHWFEIYGKIALTGEPARFENPAAQLHRWYDVYAFRVGQPRERRVAILFNDITERKLAEEALHKSQDELAHISRLTTLGELTASIAHEVNQPLAAIVTNGQASLRLLSRSKLDIDEARQAVESMIDDSLRASEVIKRIRALLKKTGPAKSTLKVDDIVQEVVALTRRELTRNHVSLLTELEPDLPLVNGDRVQLQQVMLNLILNGNEAMSSPEWQTRELLIKSERTGPDWVLVTVKDSGVGLDPKDQERVFDAFFTRKEGGLGLGLSISRNIIEDHGGKLWATPNDGPGASFQFLLPTDVENH